MDTRQWQNRSMRGLWSASPKPSTCSQNRCQTHKDVSRTETHFFGLLFGHSVFCGKNIQKPCDDFTCEHSVSVHQCLSCVWFFFRLCCTWARLRPTCSCVTSSQQWPVINGPLSWSLAPSVNVWPSSTISKSVSPKRWSGQDVWR